MMAHYLQTREQAAIEVDRYITWPGQACAYKVGEMKILQLRNKTEATLGKQSGDSGRKSVKVSFGCQQLYYKNLYNYVRTCTRQSKKINVSQSIIDFKLI